MAFRTAPRLASATSWFRSAQGLETRSQLARSAQGLEARSQLARSAQRLDVLDMGRDRASPAATATTVSDAEHSDGPGSRPGSTATTLGDAEHSDGPGSRPGPPPPPSEVPGTATAQSHVSPVGAITETGSARPSWRVRRQEKHAAKERTQEIAVWQVDQDFADEVAAVARATQKGLTKLPGLLLKTGELPFWSGTAALIEPRVQQGHFVGKSTGVSLRVAKGVNYRVGGMRGN